MEDRHRPPASMSRDAFKRWLAGRCFRYLALDHQVAQCRDPVRCILCDGPGHTSKSCPSRRNPISGELRSRLVFPARSIHSRIVFPELCPATPSNPTALPTPPPQAAAMVCVLG